MTKNLCIEVVVRELNAVRVRHHVEPAAEGVVRIHLGPPPQRPPQRADVRAQLKRIGVLTDGTGNGIRGWSADDPPLSASSAALRPQSTLMCAALMIGHHFSISAL